MDKIDTELIVQWKHGLNTEEEEVFIQNFKTFMTHNDSDFVIDLDLAYKWIGFTRKDHTKRLLEKHFIKEKDYIIQNRDNILPPPKEEENLYDKKEEQRGGHNKEYIMITPDTFKSMCLLAQTKKGKIVRGYYIKMEKIMLSHVANKMVLTQKENDELKKELEKRKHTQETAGIIYIALNQKEVQRQLYKVGHTNDAKARLSTMNTGESDSSIVYVRTFETTNRFLAEKIIHAYLKIYKFNYNKEFFNIELTYLIQIVECFVTIVNELCKENTENTVSLSEFTTKLKMLNVGNVNTLLIENTITENTENQNIPIVSNTVVIDEKPDIPIVNNPVVSDEKSDIPIVNNPVASTPVARSKRIVAPTKRTKKIKEPYPSDILEEYINDYIKEECFFDKRNMRYRIGTDEMFTRFNIWKDVKDTKEKEERKNKTEKFKPKLLFVKKDTFTEIIDDITGNYPVTKIWVRDNKIRGWYGLEFKSNLV
jgi:phage anti-repressor protein